MEPEFRICHFTDILDLLAALAQRTEAGDTLALGFDEERFLTVGLPLDLSGASLPEFVKLFCGLWAPGEALLLVSNRTGEVPANRPDDTQTWMEMTAQCSAEDVVLLDWFVIWERSAFSLAETAPTPAGWTEWGFCPPQEKGRPGYPGRGNGRLTGSTPPTAGVEAVVAPNWTPVQPVCSLARPHAECICHTLRLICMTMFSFRVDDDEAEEARRWADRLGLDRSELLRQALHRHLVRLRAESDIESWNELPMTPEESSLTEISDWGPAEDWSDWSDAAG